MDAMVEKPGPLFSMKAIACPYSLPQDGICQPENKGFSLTFPRLFTLSGLRNASPKWQERESSRSCDCPRSSIMLATHHAADFIVGIYPGSRD